MNYNDIFNQETINIFCDGSITQYKTETIGCPGCVVVKLREDKSEVIIDTYLDIIRDCTNNITENRSLLSAIYKAIYYQSLGYKNINIFGDSQLCIKTVTEWIFSWLQNFYQGHMYNSSGEIVRNEEYVKELIATIINNNLYVNFYHQKGHVKNTFDSQKKALECFKKSNGLKIVDPFLIERISYYNDYIDIITKQYLDSFIYGCNKYDAEVFKRYDYIIPATFNIQNIDVDKYKSQIKRRKRYV